MRLVQEIIITVIPITIVVTFLLLKLVKWPVTYFICSFCIIHIIFEAGQNNMERQSQSHATTQAMRGAIITLHQEGIDGEVIARRLEIHPRTVQRWISRYEVRLTLARQDVEVEDRG